MELELELEVELDPELELELKLSSDSAELSPLDMLEEPWLDVPVALEMDPPSKTLVPLFCP